MGYLGAEEAARRLHVSAEELGRLVSDGSLPSVGAPDGGVRIPEEALDELLVAESARPALLVRDEGVRGRRR
jgi:excisionase family DNA binding protein